jgi:hypothetical protein
MGMTLQSVIAYTASDNSRGRGPHPSGIGRLTRGRRTFEACGVADEAAVASIGDRVERAIERDADTAQVTRCQ